MVSSCSQEISRHKLVEERKEVEIPSSSASLATSSRDLSKMTNTKSIVTPANLHSEMAKNPLGLQIMKVNHSDLQEIPTPDFILLNTNICRILTTSRRDSETKKVALQSALETSSPCLPNVVTPRWHTLNSVNLCLTWLKTIMPPRQSPEKSLNTI